MSQYMLLWCFSIVGDVVGDGGSAKKLVFTRFTEAAATVGQGEKPGALARGAKKANFDQFGGSRKNIRTELR